MQAQSQQKRLQIVDDAKHEMGRPYRYGGERPSGFDCSGLVQYVFGNNGILLPRTSSEQSKYARRTKIRSLKPGDLLFFGSGGKVNHVGIVEKNAGGELVMIHSGSSTGVTRTRVYDSDYWSKRLKFGGVVVDDEDILVSDIPKNERVRTRTPSNQPESGKPRTRSRPAPEHPSGSTFSAEDLKRWSDKQKKRIAKAKKKRAEKKAKRKARKAKRKKHKR